MPTNNIPNIYTINGGLQYIHPLNIRDVSIVTVNRPWMRTPPQAVPWTPPVTINIGVPIVQMPGVPDAQETHLIQVIKVVV